MLRLRIDGQPSSTEQRSATGTLRTTIGGSTEAQRSLNDEAVKAFSSDHQSTNEKVELPSPQAPTPSTGRSALDGVNDLVASQARDAAAAILSLREQELALVEDSRDRAYGDGTSLRQSEAALLETEIARVSASAIVNGESALSGRTLVGSSQPGRAPSVTALPAFSTVLDSAVQLQSQTQSQADDDVARIKQSIVALGSFVAAYENATDETSLQGFAQTAEISATTLASSQSPASDDNMASLRDADEATQIAKRVAATLITPYATERQRGSLIELSSNALTEERVSLLIA